jgi:Ca2+-binding EF-hand superfamily protein
MFAKTLSHGLIAAAAFVAMNSMADTLPQARISEMMTFKTLDTNKDGMVSRAEFLQMAGKAFDMHAKETGTQGGKIDAAQLEKLRNAMFMQ